MVGLQLLFIAFLMTEKNLFTDAFVESLMRMHHKFFMCKNHESEIEREWMREMSKNKSTFEDEL